MTVKTRVKRIMRSKKARQRDRERGGRDWPGGPDGGVREPRRPKGTPPQDSIQLAEPR
ncbi:hypothetical protein Caci_0877 [Catenulispora acidiphila DSM 44928]|uniref:Uncharacterized protein n=1 Tax=Catenulispora acidiphila (strain DSM 44928 / JCM 14897 / NBRC 102108 / NRRL B-24433 / ID139908) TaxID=479433 RepID=C7Q2G8_CATAD|nr:hypothetical protein Caci_0877 [Catenulispora acidiphila DSM 44928]